MRIGWQVRTSFGGIIDLLAINPDGSLVLIELKRDKTPRDTERVQKTFLRTPTVK